MKIFTAALVFMVTLVAAAAVWASPSVDCSIDQGPCLKTVGRAEVLFEISPRPVRAMKELVFTVRFRGEKMPDTLLLDLSMPGMYMGINEVVLKKISEGVYSGKGVIPRCPSGKRLWRAEVSIPGVGKVPYTFNVNY